MVRKPKLKAQFLELYESGLDAVEICSKLGSNQRYTYKVINDFNKANHPELLGGKAGLQKDFAKVFEIAELFGVNKSAIGKTLITSAIKGNMDLSGLGFSEQKKTKREKKIDLIKDVLYVLLLVMLFIWLNVWVASVVLF